MDLIALLAQWGVVLVFAAVLLEQGGLPLPAPPILVVAGALAATGSLRPEAVLLAAFAACLVADHGWFVVGRRMGRRLLATICRLSLSPDTCVRRTDDLISRHGTALLLVAKFIPGVSAVAVPTAAAMGIAYRRFILFDALGCLIWSAAYVGLGVIFSREITRILAAMSWIGGGSLAILAALLAEDPDLLILDARSTLARAEDPRKLPRSIELDERFVLDLLPRDARDRTIVTFCTCPSEASAALLAEELIGAGYRRVRVLTGGADAVAMLSAYSSNP